MENSKSKPKTFILFLLLYLLISTIIACIYLVFEVSILNSKIDSLENPTKEKSTIVYRKPTYI